MKSKTKLWEYLIANDINIDKINELGSNGWELVSVVYLPSFPENSKMYVSYTTMINYYFKRSIR